MKISKLLWLSAYLVSLNSCDTRDDYFLEHGDCPVIEMKTSNDTLGSEYWEGKQYRVIEVGIDRNDTLSFSITDPYGKECTYDLKMLQPFPQENEMNGVFLEELLYFFGKEICEFDDEITNVRQVKERLNQYTTPNQWFCEPHLKISKTKGSLVFGLDIPRDPVEMADDYVRILAMICNNDIAGGLRLLSQTTLLHERPYSKEVVARYALTAKNKIGAETTEYLLLKIKAHEQPKPTLRITCVDNKTNEYKIIAGGIDPDGHKIVKWSYVFDYAPYPLGREPLTYEEYEPQENGGASIHVYKILDGYLYYDTYECGFIKYGMNQDYLFYYSTFGMTESDLKRKKIEVDFITPTTRNEVYHVFQSKGEHTVSVRCQDEYGLWSDYITEKIYIE